MASGAAGAPLFGERFHPSPETREPTPKDPTQQAAAATFEQQAAAALEALAVLRKHLDASESLRARVLGEDITHCMLLQVAQLAKAAEVRHPQQAGMGSGHKIAFSLPLDQSPALLAAAFLFETARDATVLCSRKGPWQASCPRALS